MSTLKTCTMCRLNRPVSEFHRDRGKRDRLRANCKSCAREHERVRKWFPLPPPPPPTDDGLDGPTWTDFEKHINERKTAMTNASTKPNFVIQVPDPGTEWVSMTPKLAAECMAMNPANRHMRRDRIERYKADMLNGEWYTTGATIQFAENGNLIDGQHRLQAVIESGYTIRQLIVTGVRNDIFDVTDAGASRDGRDALTARGYRDRRIAAIATTAAGIAKNLMKGIRPLTKTGNNRKTAHDINKFVMEHPELMESVQFVEPFKPTTSPPLAHSAGAALHYLMGQYDIKRANEFMTQIYTGADMPANHIVLRLRNKLIIRVQQKKTTMIDGEDNIAACIRVWNLIRSGKTMADINKAFQRNPDGIFPELI